MNQAWRFPNPATAPGSSAYYSLLFAPPDLRDDLAALLAWRGQLRNILDEVRDPGVARLKLQWWREELERIYGGEPRHPLSQILAPAVARHALPAAPFSQVADQVESEIPRRQPEDEAGLNRACDHDLGALFELQTRCHGLEDADTLSAARVAGSFCSRVYLIRDSGALARERRTVLPIDLLHEMGLSVEALTERAHRQRLPELLASAAAQTRSLVQGSAPSLALPAAIRVRTSILAGLLRELEHSGFDLAEQRTSLTPLRKLWIGWRESRRRPVR